MAHCAVSNLSLPQLLVFQGLESCCHGTACSAPSAEACVGKRLLQFMMLQLVGGLERGAAEGPLAVSSCACHAVLPVGP